MNKYNLLIKFNIFTKKNENVQHCKKKILRITS